MLRALALVLFGVMGTALLKAQQPSLESLLQQEKSYLQEDSVRAKLLCDIARKYANVDPQMGGDWGKKAILLSQKLPEKKFLATAYSVTGANMLRLPNYPDALENYFKALEINEQQNNLQGIGNNYNNIGLVYYAVFDFPKALEYYHKALGINERTGNRVNMANSLGNIGNIHNELHDYPKAIEYYERALTLSEAVGNLQITAGNLVNLGNVYTQLQNFPKALEYKERALKLNEQLGNQSAIANNLGNIGNVYLEMGNLPAARHYHERALAISEKINDKQGAAFNYASIGNILSAQNDPQKAIHFETRAYEIASSIGMVSMQSEASYNLSRIYESLGQYDSAYLAYRGHILLRDSINNVEKQKQVTKQSLQFEFGKREEAMRQQQALTDAQLQQQILLATQRQQELELKQKAVDLANKEKQIQHLAYLKSQADLQFEQSQTRQKEEQLALAENEKMLQATQVNLQQTQLQLKDRELQTRKTQGFVYLGGLILLSLLSFFIYRNFLNQQKSNRIIHQEKQKSDELLLNILPVEVANELKEQGQAMAQQFDEVTVLFTDFVNFTSISEQLSAQELVSELHFHFKNFDEIIERNGLEKIKTIGDAYMAVSGLPVSDAKHAQKAIRAALEIQTFVRAQQTVKAQPFEIRIGLHSGPVVAGIVGVKKFAYDIWGDTVNTAARMESSSEPGKINISGATFELVKNEYLCQHRGKITAKNKGEIDMYFVGS
jgi:class 3 adenylate cyclase/tetratricopeptide (TPR) repeat protein